ncbi:MAG: hypothetical protein BWY15_02096 [Firmicutes bacterium ADurb.Bin193]|nr:MAG: hypothetical protein BWY15_02096 [Firmicutes bacterium ADurb.Bin193]
MAKGYDKLILQLNKMIVSDRAGIAAVNSVLAEQKKRIFQQGKASSGGKIGSYSTEPISISKKNQARQTGKTYFKGGYRQYKSLIGKGANTVNLRNTDQMMMDLGTTVVGKGKYGIGFTNQFNADKAEWNEERYDKKIFDTTAKEDNTFARVYEFEIRKIE